jgi:hypothetical protein
MKRLFLTLALFLGLASYAGAAASRTSVATDAFAYSTGALHTVSGGNWAQAGDTGWGAMEVTSGTIFGSATAGQSVASAARWTGAGSFTDNQYAKIVVPIVTNGGDNNSNIGVACRASGVDGTRSFYYAWVTANFVSDPNRTVQTGKYVSGTHTQQHSANFAFAAGNTIEIECNGTTITVLKDGVALGGSYTWTDSDITTGKPGVTGMGNNAATVSGDTWEGGNLDSAASSATGVLNRRRGQ